MILGSDDFNRVTGTLGAGWTEHGLTTMSCDGTHARVDAFGQGHLATLAGTSQRDTYLQCWMLGPGAGNTVGVIWRFQDTSNYYLLRYTTSWGVFRIEGGAANAIGGTFAGDPASIPKRLVVRHVGTRIQVYVDNLYDTGTGREGPLLDATDADVQGSAWVGTAGLSCSAVNAAAITDVKWNDFIVFDGGPQIIYVDTAFNGGAAGEGMGTSDRPDLTVKHALNNAGLNVQGTIKLQSLAIETNGATPHFSIGHGGKFGRSAYSFPTYDDANGKVVSAGDPNLTIEGRDGGRSVLRENAGSQLFNMRDDAKGILFRGFDFELTGAVASAAIRTAAHDGTDPGDHSFAVHKCRFDLNTTADAIDRVVQLFGAQTRVEILYNYIRVNTTGVNTFLAGSAAADAVQNLRVRMNVFDYRNNALPNTGDIGVVVGRAAAAGVRVGDTWDIDHNTFIEVRSAGADDNALGLWDAADVDGDVEFQNNIVFGQSVGEPTGFGVRVAAGAITGTVRAHHNGYFRVTTPRSAQVTNQGNEVDATDPVFTNPSTGTVFAWQHTAGQGLLGEGTFAAIAIEGDFRPTDPAYVDSADDSDPLLGVLDRGALQSFFVAPPIPGQSLPEAVPDSRVFCASIIFDPGGAQEFDLSSRLFNMIPIRVEKDVLLRSYRPNDVSIEVNDKDGIFIESNPDSPLLDPVTGEPNWYGKRVAITALFGTDAVVRFSGYLLGIDAGPGTTVLRIGNRFQQLLDRPLLANTLGQIVTTDGSKGIGPVTSHFEVGPHRPISGVFLGDMRFPNQSMLFPPTSNTLRREAACGIETWTVTWLEGGQAPEYEVSGSVTGFDGRARVFTSIFVPGGTFYESRSGKIEIHSAQASPSNVPGDFFGTVDGVTPEQKCTIRSVYRFQQPMTSVAAFIQLLLDPLGAGLTSSDIDPAVYDLLGTGNDQPYDAHPYFTNPLQVDRGLMVFDQPITVLEALNRLALHIGAVMVEKSDGKIGLDLVTPKLVASPPTICNSDDLISARLDHLPIYNRFGSDYDFDEKEQRYRLGIEYPDVDKDNDSYVRYERLYEAPNRLVFVGFRAGGESWIRTILDILYRRYKDPRLTADTRLKISRIGAELTDVYRLDSEVPTTTVAFMQPFEIGRQLAGALEQEMKLLDLSEFIRTSNEECGYAYHDIHPHDGCWTEF